jgi:O-antigen/teichoic acid export membrane protein
MVANIGSGGLMWLVHFLSKRVTTAEYGAFGVMLAVAMCVPNMPLQMVFAQQTARALATQRERELAGMLRLACLGTLIIGGLLAGVVYCWQTEIITGWKLASASGLWITVGVVVLCMWLPIFQGVMQGQQNFLWIGWANLLNGVGRLSLAASLVIGLAWGSTGMIAGVVLAMVLAVGVCVWQTRRIWMLPRERFHWRQLAGQAAPLILGFAAVQFLFTADTMFVKAYFSEEDAGFYVGAGTLSRALLWLVLPLAVVMFPKIVHSSARAEKSNLLGVVMAGTAILAAGGALGLTILGPWLVRFVFTSSYVQVASLILPWYAWAMVPLSLANALINNLMARAQFGIVPVLLALAIGYGFALVHFHDSLIMVLKTLGVFNLLLLAVSGWFTWVNRKNPIK